MNTYRSKKSTLLFIDILSIIVSFTMALVIRFRLLAIDLGSYVVVTTYVPFFFVVLTAYIVITVLRREIRIERMSIHEVIVMTIEQQSILTVVYIAIFFVFHKSEAISRIVVGLFFIFSVALSIIGRTGYHIYCIRKKEIYNSVSETGTAEDNTKKNATNQIRHVYIIGSKSIGQYGGYESFVMNLLQQHKDNSNIKYHVACKANGQGHMDIDSLPGVKRKNEKEFSYYSSQCFLIRVPAKLGSAQAIYYDLRALRWCCEHIERHHIEEPIVYILASRVEPFEKHYVKRIHDFEGLVFQNPDGACEIIGTTGEKPVKTRLSENSVIYPNSNTEYQIKKSYSGFLKRFCAMPGASWCTHRAFSCWNPSEYYMPSMKYAAIGET